MVTLGAGALLTRNLAIAVCGGRGQAGGFLFSRKVAKLISVGIHWLTDETVPCVGQLSCQRRLFSGWRQSASVPTLHHLDMAEARIWIRLAHAPSFGDRKRRQAGSSVKCLESHTREP